MREMERTDNEILSRIKSLENDPADFFGFQRSDLIGYLPFESAKPFLKEGATKEDWPHHKPRNRQSVMDDMLSYMSFAWEKANNNRGLSAARSINHMQSWLWMLGEEDAAKAIEDYDLYGKPQLRAICEHFGWDWEQWDDGRWANDETSEGAKPPSEVNSLPFKTAA